jgi:DNA-binding transcriptional regulator YdaS (Cro superfamily)
LPRLVKEKRWHKDSISYILECTWPKDNSVQASVAGEEKGDGTPVCADRDRWQTPFARAVRRLGVARLARELEVDPSSIYQWIRGVTKPRHECVVKILEMASAEKLELSYSDIQGQPVCNEARQRKRKSKRTAPRTRAQRIASGVTIVARELGMDPRSLYQRIVERAAPERAELSYEHVFAQPRGAEGRYQAHI